MVTSENRKGFTNKETRGGKSLKDFPKLIWQPVDEPALMLRLSASEI